MPDSDPAAIELKRYPVLDYLAALEEQRRLHRLVQTGDSPGFLMLVQHPPTLTLGRHATADNLLWSRDQYEAQGVAVVETDRGGEVTAHMPGQTVMYPIIPLARHKLSPRPFVDKLMQAVIATLGAFAIEAHQDPEHPGVWVGADKICAVGVRIRSRVSMHGIALNVNNSLSLFEAIVPCGIHGRGVTSMSWLRGEPVDQRLVEQCLVRNFADKMALPIRNDG
jgi:lipoate-protein ligase B